MLVVEGADLVGKSTLVKRAVARLNEKYGMPHMPMHLTRPPESFDYCSHYLDKMSVATVWDRFHLSCLAYRQHDYHPCSMTPLKYQIVDAHLRMMGGIVLLVTASDALIRERYARRSDDMYDLEHILRVNETFRELGVEPNWCVVRGRHYSYALDSTHYVKDESEESLIALNHWIDCQVDAYVERIRELQEMVL